MNMKNILITENILSLDDAESTRIVYDKTNDCLHIQTKEPYKFIDLGLSVKWATYNLGATKEDEVGALYAWGETTGYFCRENGMEFITEPYGGSDTKYGKAFWNGDYKFYTYSDGYIKYNEIDGISELYTEDDAAYYLNNTMRIPSEVNCEELINNTTLEIITINNVSGVQLTSTVEGYTDKSIFIPMFKYAANGSLNLYANNCNFWLRNKSNNGDMFAKTFSYNENVEIKDMVKYIGLPIRPVKEK